MYSEQFSIALSCNQRSGLLLDEEWKFQGYRGSVIDRKIGVGLRRDRKLSTVACVDYIVQCCALVVGVLEYQGAWSIGVLQTSTAILYKCYSTCIVSELRTPSYDVLGVHTSTGVGA